jgi:hypothetical protein
MRYTLWNSVPAKSCPTSPACSSWRLRIWAIGSSRRHRGKSRRRQYSERTDKVTFRGALAMPSGIPSFLKQPDFRAFWTKVPAWAAVEYRARKRMKSLPSATELCGKLGCAPKARVTCGGRFHPDSCRLVWKLTSGSVGQLAGLEPRDKGRLGRLSDPAGRNVSEV